MRQNIRLLSNTYSQTAGTQSEFRGEWHALTRYSCCGCKTMIDPEDKFCRGCGARLIGMVNECPCPEEEKKKNAKKT